MEKCIYNGKTLYAYEVLQNFEFEKVIRKCPTLICCDCGASVFFRHGKQRTECFVHKHKEECRYGDYCRKQSEIFKHAQRELTVHLQRIAEQHNYQLEEDVMIIPAHYTAFVLRSVSVSYAIDIIDSAATTATLEKHKNMYLQKGYQYLQITVDKNAEHESFSERTMAYLPVKFALNESLNHTALVIDKEYRTWSIYILDKTNISTEYELMPYVLYNDTFAMSISLDDLNINNLGFYTASSNDAYNSFCQTRKQAYVEWTHEQEKILKQTQIEMENEHKRAEQQRLEKERITVEIRVQRQQAEAAKKKAEEEAKQQRQLKEIQKFAQIHTETGGYIGAKVKGEYQIFTLEEIASEFPKTCISKKYSITDFKERIKKMQEYRYTETKILFTKMCYISSEEKEILLEIYNELKESHSDIVDDIEYLMKNAGIV